MTTIFGGTRATPREPLAGVKRGEDRFQASCAARRQKFCIRGQSVSMSVCREDLKLVGVTFSHRLQVL